MSCSFMLGAAWQFALHNTPTPPPAHAKGPQSNGLPNIQADALGTHFRPRRKMLCMYLDLYPIYPPPSHPAEHITDFRGWELDDESPRSDIKASPWGGADTVVYACCDAGKSEGADGGAVGECGV